MREPETSDGGGAGRSDGPRGGIAWVRRRVLPLAGRGLAVLGALVLAGWLTGRILTDEHLWSQYLYWVPTPWVVGAGLALWCLSWACGALSVRMGGDLVRPLLLLGVLGAGAWMLGVEWRGYRAVRVSADSSRPSLRVVFFNNASRADMLGAERELAALGADVAVIAGPTTGPRERDELRDALRRSVAGEGEAGGTTHWVERHGLWIVTRHPMLRTGETWLRATEGGDAGWRTAGYGGRAVWVELDTSAVFGQTARPFTLWVIDLPSDPTLHKAAPASEARRAIERFEGPALIPDGLGGWTPSGEPVPGFPAPDAVVGDFNTPRGSASLETIVGSMASAHAQGGFGPDFTWEQPWAWWAIDLMFVGEGWRARRFDAVGLDGHAHAAIVGDLVRE
ncbi:MAG: endonuclease/exonuclease/phosphatase family protein [Phycisphaerales bacterium JB040]